MRTCAKNDTLCEKPSIVFHTVPELLDAVPRELLHLLLRYLPLIKINGNVSVFHLHGNDTVHAPINPPERK